MGGILQDLRCGLRALRQRPGLWLVATLALALGIGANTAVFSVINATLLRKLPLPKPEQLVEVYTGRDPAMDMPLSGADFLDVRAQAKSFSGVAAYRAWPMNLGGESTERVRGVISTTNFFKVLGATPLVGRTLEEAAPGAREVLLGEGLWRTRFGASRGVVGLTITLDGEPYAIRGVISAAQAIPRDGQLWVPPRRNEVPQHPTKPLIDTSSPSERGSHFLEVIARLADGVSPMAARTELLLIAARMKTTYKQQDTSDGFTFVGLQETLVGDVRPMLLVLFGAVAFILLIACANVGNLLLARSLARQQEVAVRVALGATRSRLLRLFFCESLAIALPGAALGLLVALWGAPPLIALGPNQLLLEDISLDWRVLAFTAGVCLVTAFAFGLLPALSSPEAGDSLRPTGRAATGGVGHGRLRSALVAAEVALSLVLLIGAGLMIRSFLRLHSVSPGLDPQSVLTADVTLPAARYPDRQRQGEFFRSLVAHVAASPQVESAGAVSRLPLTPGNSTRSIGIGAVDGHEPNADYRLVGGDYFAALRIPLQQGRAFLPEDTAAGRAIVNAAFARLAFPGENPIGKRIGALNDNRMAEVVGVVADIRERGLNEAPRPQVYVPFGADPWTSATLVVRCKVPPMQLVPLVQEALQKTDRDLALSRISSMEARVEGSLATRKFAVLLLSVLAAVALVLAVTGLYGVMAYSVAQRTREMGIRLALGATPASVVQLVVRHAMGLVGLGLGAGVIGALLATRALQGFLYGISATDPATFAGICAVVAATGCAAGLVAAWKATRVDPAIALRAE